ncbi:hypothetical protein [Xanthomonas vasicola]|nr:hypothetical protein [Xanthomonas vasicola]
MISASHNPHYDNGIKFFSASGGARMQEAPPAAAPVCRKACSR